MKTLILLILFSFRFVLMAYEVKVHVVDDAGVPISGVKASIFFVNAREDEQHDVLTDKNGNASASGRGTDSVGIIVEQQGYYSARVERLKKDRDHDVKVVLPRIINPTALYAVSEVVRKFPGQGEWFGFDLEVSDWVAPHGKGKVTDVRFRFHNQFVGWQEGERGLARARNANPDLAEALFMCHYGKWDAVMEISFPGELEGLLTEKRFLQYSQLKMSHMAPLDGYQPTYRRDSNNYNGVYANSGTGFFLRTRVKLNEKGEMVSANYTKIRGDLFPSAPWAAIRFSYYFNPIPNDRNLEFDPKKNLFPKDMLGADVSEP